MENDPLIDIGYEVDKLKTNVKWHEKVSEAESICSDEAHA
jgi:hypothetical protein